MKIDMRPLKVGDRIGGNLTVVGVLDKYKRNPVYIVWNHASWCPMACKTFRTLQRARREADVLSILAHPNTVRLLGVGSPPHIIMEFLEGPTLRRFIDDQPRRRLSVSDAVRVTIHVGGALNHVHDHGFMHLDVKPSNIIVVRSRPILYDFGAARRQGNLRPRGIAGTDPYIAPEECQRKVVTPAADVFSLGVTLYEMLTGELPFPEGTRRDPFPQVHRPPTPPRKHRPSLPRPLENIVLQCLARAPEKRIGIAHLLPALHDFIRVGPRMWPASFTPAQRPGSRPPRHK